jgi:hypothetical protein
MSHLSRLPRDLRIELTRFYWRSREPYSVTIHEDTIRPDKITILCLRFPAGISAVFPIGRQQLDDCFKWLIAALDRGSIGWVNLSPSDIKITDRYMIDVTIDDYPALLDVSIGWAMIETLGKIVNTQKSAKYVRRWQEQRIEELERIAQGR